MTVFEGLPKPPQGSVVLAPGRVVGVVQGGGKAMYSFAVESVVVDPKCTATYAAAAERGHYVALAVVVRTTADVSPAEGTAPITAYDFAVTGVDGVTETQVSSTFMCLPEAEYHTTEPYLPSAQYGGVVMLDTKSAHGVIEFRPDVTAAGWEWAF
ncbi:hypothetical protein JOD54_001066 [Actinokineospora baliensis]|uniref:hypothetical protein n=1 Tax=Actinokineospora baliensis TaxID=547056 RepID=UPI00195DC812|nr:hypothetical protein [Actinokineospora baliensis]MBM7770862.1 hypothetical protein [Actinokineospora baliensis]